MLIKSYYHATRRIDDENGLKKCSIDTKGLLLVNFWAVWSIQCHHMSDVMRDMKTQINDTDTIVYIDWDLQRGLAKNMEVYGVPILLIYFGGHEVGRLSGVLNAGALTRHINTLAMRISE